METLLQGLRNPDVVADIIKREFRQHYKGVLNIWEINIRRGGSCFISGRVEYNLSGSAFSCYFYTMIHLELDTPLDICENIFDTTMIGLKRAFRREEV